MRTRMTILTVTVVTLCAVAPLKVQGQALLPNGAAEEFLGAGVGDTPDSQQYADGTKAIRESRWVDAVKLFDKVAQTKGPHAAGALYWKAYAEGKLGNVETVLSTCTELRTQFVGSTWIDDCGALEIEMRAKNDQPVQPEEQQNDELKLLALSALMQKDPTRAKAQIEEIVKGDTSESLKEGALFILGKTEPDASYPEIVRISYLEGDVRIARASKNDGDDEGATWETAVMNLPLEEGDNLVTGKDGRVEIEFEDDSTVYLAENSALNFEDMHSTSGVPHTEVALVSGAVTMHLDSLMPGETFVLHTPTNELLTRYPQNAEMRVSSYLDGITVTPLTPGQLDVAGSGSRQEVTADQTLVFAQGQKMTSATTGQTPDYKAFDAWVADRYAAREADTEQVMQEAGLQRPIPGLAQLKGKGAFYDCEPYGKCWQPTPKKSLTSGGAAGAGVSSGSMAFGGGVGAPVSWDMDSFPCMPWAMGYGYGMGHMYGYGTGFMTFQPAMPMPADVSYQGMMDPFTAWALCHAGYWLPRQNGGYAWVVGRRIHHHPPVHWLKEGRREVAVPLHPRDVKDQLPVNREYGFLAEKSKQGLKVTPVKIEGSLRLELMKQPPREFRNLEEPRLGKAEAPQMMAHSLKPNEGAKPGMARAGVPLTFDRQQGFMAMHQVMQGGRAVAVNTPVGRTGPAIGGHGSAPSGFGAAGGFHGGSGGFHGGSVSASSGGGASHGGSAGSGSISVSSASTASSSSAASSSGSHK